jgi:hypothetical protein
MLTGIEDMAAITCNNQLDHWVHTLNEAIDDAKDVIDVFYTHDFTHQVEMKKGKYITQLFRSSSNDLAHQVETKQWQIDQRTHHVSFLERFRFMTRSK